MTDSRLAGDSPAMAPTDTLPHRVIGAMAKPEGRLSVPTLEQVYEAHFKYVWRCTRSLGVHDAVLDDAVQEVFLVVQRKLDSFDGGCEVRTWLYAIVLRVARRYRSRSALEARRFLSHDDASEPSHSGIKTLGSLRASAGDLRQEVEKNERLALAQRALAALDDSKREVFVLACIEGMSAPEIAQVIAVPINTVYSRLRAARQAFGQAVSELQGTAEESSVHLTQCRARSEA